MNKIIKINSDNGRIVVSAPSHYGKTYLVATLLKSALKNSWKVFVLAYSRSEAEQYWNKLEELGAEIVYAERTDERSLIDFLAKTTNGNCVVYIDDLDLYLNTGHKYVVNMLKNLLSAGRKANMIMIFSMKELKGYIATALVNGADILFLGRFPRYSNAWNSFGIENLQDIMNSLNPHEFIFRDNETNETKIVKAENDKIVVVRSVFE